MFMFTWSLTGWDDFYSIVMWEPFKHLRIKFTHCKCVVQTISQVKWRWFYSGMRGFNCLVVVLFSYVFMLSTRFVRTSGNGLCHKTWSHFLFAQHLEALWWTCLRYDIFFLMLETEELISKIGSLHILQEASELWSCN